MGKLRIIGELMEYLWSNKKIWLIPIVVMLLVLGIIIVTAQGSALAPFIYTLF